jgi:DNA-binding MarR family transcriptional regulator
MIGALLNISSHALQQRVYQAYKAAGFSDLTPSTSIVFQVLSPDGDHVTNLAKRANMTKQSMGYLVDTLVREGYLELLPDPADRRAQLVRRTAKGWEVNRIAREAVEIVQAEWTDYLGTEKMEYLLGLLRELADLIGVQYQGSAAESSLRKDTEPPAT